MPDGGDSPQIWGFFKLWGDNWGENIFGGIVGEKKLRLERIWRFLLNYDI